ncbi:unnamed protein product [Closterium sp. Naga37s-1]|nr:unnamed protein product [Closterium sp. Naga37s-1]
MRSHSSYYSLPSSPSAPCFLTLSHTALAQFLPWLPSLPQRLPTTAAAFSAMLDLGSFPPLSLEPPHISPIPTLISPSFQGNVVPSAPPFSLILGAAACHTFFHQCSLCHTSSLVAYAVPHLSFSALCCPASSSPPPQVPYAPLALPHTPLFLQGIIPFHAAPAYRIGADPEHTHIPPLHSLSPLLATSPLFCDALHRSFSSPFFFPSSLPSHHFLSGLPACPSIPLSGLLACPSIPLSGLPAYPSIPLWASPFAPRPDVLVCPILHLAHSPHCPRCSSALPLCLSLSHTSCAFRPTDLPRSYSSPSPRRALASSPEAYVPSRPLPLLAGALYFLHRAFSHLPLGCTAANVRCP